MKSIWRRAFVLSAFVTPIAAVPVKAADCTMMQKDFREYLSATDALDRETTRYTSTPGASRHDAELCKAAQAATRAIEHLQLSLDKACLGDPSKYSSLSSDLDDEANRSSKQAGLACAP